MANPLKQQDISYPHDDRRRVVGLDIAPNDSLFEYMGHDDNLGELQSSIIL
jgi:hypothetical protein